MPRILKLTVDGIEPEESAPSPDRLIAGDPRFKTWDVDHTTTGLYAGLWEATPGKWAIDYEEWEYFHVLSGLSVVTEEGREPVRLGPGDSYILRPGFKGTWEVVETTRKEYVIYI